MATAILNPSAQITALGEQSKKTANIGLETAKNKSLADLAIEQQKIAPEYQKQRNTVDINSQVASKNFAEFMAQRGQNNAIGNSGSLAQGTIANNAMKQGNLGSLAKGEALANTNMGTQRSNVNTAYNTGVQQSNASIDTNTLNQLIQAQQTYNQALREQENQDRAFKAQQDQQALDNAYRQQQAQQAQQAQANAERASSSSSSSANSKAEQADTLARTTKSINDEVYGQPTQEGALRTLTGNKGDILGMLVSAGMPAKGAMDYYQSMYQDLTTLTLPQLYNSK